MSIIIIFNNNNAYFLTDFKNERNIILVKRQRLYTLISVHIHFNVLYGVNYSTLYTVHGF